MTLPPSSHPESDLEIHKLQDTLAILKARIVEVGELEPQGTSRHSTSSLIANLYQMYENLKTARKQVYFGRLDFTPSGAVEPETHYFGRIGFDQDQRIVVVDWRAPAAHLFSRRRPGTAAYDSPDGRVEVDLHLKRQLIVDGATLRGLFDEYDTRPSARPAAEPRLVDPDAYLREILSGRRDVQMQDIVATIQEHQDGLIRADPRQVLVIQGVAGSGKTSIALHRVAFLLYPGNRTGIDAQRCIVFGPNQLFLAYIANVLPGLGVAGIPQTTLDAWALERMGLAGRRLTDIALDALLAGRPARAAARALAPRSQLKASRRMGRVLDNLLIWHRTRLDVPERGLAYRDLGPLRVTVKLTRSQIEAAHKTLTSLPIVRQRERLEEELLGLLMGGYASALDEPIDAMQTEGESLRERAAQMLEDARRLDEHVAVARRETSAELEKARVADSLARGVASLRALAVHCDYRGEHLVLRAASLREDATRGGDRAAVRAVLSKALRGDLDVAWPAFDALAAYFDLLSDEQLLTRLARGILTADEIALLHGSPAPDDDALDVSDLPALCYLHTHAHGVAAALYDHIVVDEAQDVAPLYFAVLRLLSRNGSLTILGDLAQGVYSHRGIVAWEDVLSVFDGLPFSYSQVSESYRSTHEIITFANRLLELVTPPGHAPLLAAPFERRGPPVRLHRLEGRQALAPALVEAIAGLRREHFQNIALITKTAEQCQALAQSLHALGLHDAQVIAAPDQHYAGGVVILPVHLAKGMEFEAVLIGGADEDSYAAAEFDGRLLYVAATRALHTLQIFTTDAPNLYVELAAG